MRGTEWGSGGPPIPQEPTIELKVSSPKILAIFTSPEKGAPMISHDEIAINENAGLENDRYNLGIRKGIYSGKRDENRQLTIINQGQIELANKELVAQGIAPFTWQETRRNVITEMDPEQFAALQIGQEITIGGDVRCRIVEVCIPCSRPAKVAERAKADGLAFTKAFRDSRGGYRLQVLNTGVLHIDDTIAVLPPPENA